MDQACALGVLAGPGRAWGSGDASMPLLKAKALDAAARECAHAGHRAQARAAFASAVEVYTALGAAADVARLRATPR